MIRGIVISGLMAVLAVSACVQPTGGGGNSQGNDNSQPVTLRFAAQVGDEEAVCDTMYDGLGTSGESAEVLDMRLYISNIRLINDQGEEVRLTLDQDDRWQVEDVALLDFEDGSGACGDSGTDETNSVVTGTAPQGTYVGVTFDLAVPFNLNHEDLAAAPSPLNVSAMFWAWSVGHKFIKVDVQTEGELLWSMHLGSTGCETDGPTDPPVSECSNPNRPVIRLDAINLAADTIVFDLQELFAASDLTQDTPDSSSGCQSFDDDTAECTNLYPTLGLDFATGECIDDCDNQSVFRIDSGVARGLKAFTTLRETSGGEMLACISCHGDDGSGGVGPDIRPASTSHLYEHAHGAGPHPQGVKFTGLTEAHCYDIRAYLASFCAADPDCEPDDDQGPHH